jgi:hypothetical protein
MLDKANLLALKAEIDGDPLIRGYSGMSDQAVADDINTVYRSRNKTSITGDEMFQATDGAEFTALTEHKEQSWLSFCGRDSLDPYGAANVAFAQYIFGGGSTTLANLNALRIESISRADELGIGRITAGDVVEARAFGG